MTMMRQPVGGELFSGDSEMMTLMRAVDWRRTALGDVDTWPASLLVAVDICLGSRFPMVLFWGAERIQIYNDAYRPMLGEGKHPQFLARPGSECWFEVWDTVGPMMDSVVETGQGTWSADLLLTMLRNGYPEETYFTFSYSPIRDGAGVGGVFNVCQETTEQVLSRRRLDLLRELSVDATTPRDAGMLSAEVLAHNPLDVPFALIYYRNDADTLELCGNVGTDAGNVRIAAAAQDTLDRVESSGVPEEFANLRDLFRDVPAGAWPEAPTSAYVLPLTGPGQAGVGGAVVLGISPRRAFDPEYRNFFELVASRIASSIASARAHDDERKRAEALAQLDRAKTAFFSNVSHEFRTPLTLLLGPLADLEAHLAQTLAPADAELLSVAQRNSKRLLRLVNTLLDFSRIEAGRVEASYEPTDLAEYTASLASMFRSAFDRASLSLIVDCPPLSQPAYVDRDMWEKIVMNLISNAFKFTFTGSVTVALRERGEGAFAELTVADTGVGVPEHELPLLFDRFHRVEGAPARTHEGSGIGLALVQDLTRLHGGNVSAESTAGNGTTFTVALPLGSGHLPPDRIAAERRLASTALGAEPFVEEALRWLPDTDGSLHRGEPSVIDLLPEQGTPMTSATDGARILLADDNADMREYLASLLSPRWHVEAVADGRSALASARANPPDLVLSDVMMPVMDGMELLRALRADPATQAVPVVLLSARAGEESRVAGMEHGADDYLVKPFSARELIASIAARLEVARIRKEGNDAVERERDNLRNVIMQSPVPMCTLRGNDLVVEITNAAYHQITGRDNVDTIGMPLLDSIPELRGQGFDTLMHEVMRTGTPYIGRETLVQLARGDGIEDMYVTFIYAPMRDSHGVIDGVIVVASVVTEQVLARRAIEHALGEQEKLNSALEAQTEKLRLANATKDEFLSLVSHELKTPITTIYGNAEVLRTRFDVITDEGRRAAIEDISGESERLHRIIDNLLVLARGQRDNMDPEPLLVRRLVEQVIREHERRFPMRHIELKDAAPDGATVDAQAIHIEQVMRNLLSNAEKYSDTDRPINVQIEPTDDGMLAIEVLDRGIGFSMEDTDSFFTLFYRSSTAGQKASGIGIGLVVCKRVIEAHGGRVWIAPREGGGSIVGFALPFAAPLSDDE